MTTPDQNNEIDETDLNVARQIRALRERRNLSQRALAEASGLSRNTLSLLERGHTSPTVSTLKRLSNALGVDINAFFSSSDEESIVYTKTNQRQNMQVAHGLMADLGAGIHDQLVTPLILQLNPGARSGPALSHEGQDFVFCLRGRCFIQSMERLLFWNQETAFSLMGSFSTASRARHLGYLKF